MLIPEIYNIKNLKINKYDHGGSRIYLEDDKGNRQLLCDTYGNNFIVDNQIRETIIIAIKQYLEEIS